MRTVLMAMLIAGCAMDGRGGDGKLVEVEDTGQACLLGHEPAGTQRTTYPADQPVTISASAFACLSSGCTTDQIASCEVTVTGTTIAITTRASWRDISRLGGACTDDCSSPLAECTTPPLAAGTYTVTFGRHETTLVVPSVLAGSPCLGDGF